MFKINMGEVVVQIDNQFSEVEDFCSLYRAADCEKADFSVLTSPEDREKNKRWHWEHEQNEISDAAAERDQIQHKIYVRLPEFGAFWLHACVVEVGGEAYAFSAPSGYGKTTHVALWKKLFGKNARVINGDNPVIREKNGTFYAYGTPWCGKEGWSVNTKAALKAVCYIEHSDRNTLEQLNPLTAYHRLVAFSRYYQCPENLDETLSLYEHFVTKVPFYQINCNMDIEAAKVAYEGMSGKRAPEYEAR